MDNKRKDENEELSTEELIRRLMENFGDEDEAAGEEIKLPTPEEGEEPSQEEMFAEIEEETTSVFAEPASEPVQSEKFKFRVQKSRVEKGAAIPRVTDSLEGVLVQEEETDEPVQMALPLAKDQDKLTADEFIEDENAVAENSEKPDSYEEISRIAKEVLDEEKAEEPQRETIFSENDKTDFGQISEDDVNLMMIFGEEGENGEVQEKKTEDEAKQVGKVEDEYDDVAKRDSFLIAYRKKYNWVRARMALAALVMLLCAVVEGVAFFGGDLPGMLSAKNYPEIHLLISVQLTLFASFVALPEIIGGVRTAVCGCPDSGILLVLGSAFNLVYEILLAVSRNHVGTPTFNLPLALCALLAVTNSWMRLKSEMMAFDVISFEGVKFTATRQKEMESELEKDAFDQYLDESPRIFGIQKTEFVTDFVANHQKYAKRKSVCGVTATLTVIVAVVFLILGYYRTGNLLDGLGYCQLALMLCLPFSAFLVFGLPMYRAAKKAYEIDSAIVGDASVDEYADASVVSFNDSDVFPTSGVKVRSIKLYGNSRIDKVLYTVSGVFDKLGGPLADVFRQATKDLGGHFDVDILESKPGGVEAAVDGVHVYCGNGTYIHSCGFVPAYDPNDVRIEREGKLSIFFVVIGGDLAAKMYIEYRMDPEIKDIVGALYKAGMCMGVRTLDPNIDDSMLGRRIRLTEYPVRVLQCKSKEQLSGVQERAGGGVVSRRSAKNLLKTLTLCDRTQLLSRIGVAVKILSVLAGVVATALLYAFGSFTEIHSVHVLAYQLFWLIPTYILSMLFI